MLKKLSYLLFFLYCFTNPTLAKNVFISVTVDNKIITNLDIEKESEYLKIFNPNLVKLEKKKILDIAKNSLINEIIKKNEIEKIFEYNTENPFVEDYLRNLYTKLNFQDENSFNKFLIQKKIYTLDEIKEKIKIEVLWNELIYIRYNNQVKINKQNISKKINEIDNEIQTEYLLSEIVLEKKNNEDLQTLLNKIINSINEIGFNNTANLYSVSESAKFGGKIGWVNKNNLSNQIYKNLKMKKEGEFTDVIKIGNNYLLLNIEKIKETAIKIDKEQELKKMIKFETNKQLNQFSRIFFNKAKLNYLINEK